MTTCEPGCSERGGPFSSGARVRMSFHASENLTTQAVAVLGRRHAAERLVRPLLVVVEPPSLRQPPRLAEGVEDEGVQDAPAVAAVEPLDVRVLCGVTRLREYVLHAVRGAPVGERGRDELRAVVAAYAPGLAVREGRLLDGPHHARRGHRHRHLHGHGLARAVVQYVEHPERAPALELVAHEVHRPRVARRRRAFQRPPVARRDALAAPTGLAHPHRLVDAVDPLVVPRPAGLAQPREYLPEAVAMQRGLPYGLLDLAVATPPPRVVEARLVVAHQAARPGDADPVLLSRPSHQPPLVLGGQIFFSRISLRILLSSDASAYICLRRRFSTSSSRRRSRSLTSMPLYFDFQL